MALDGGGARGDNIEASGPLMIGVWLRRLKNFAREGLM